jgi:hypothetical protein
VSQPAFDAAYLTLPTEQAEYVHCQLSEDQVEGAAECLALGQSLAASDSDHVTRPLSLVLCHLQHVRRLH